MTSKKLISRVLINTDQPNVVYEVLFHSSLTPIVKIMNITASVQQGFFNLMIKYTALLTGRTKSRLMSPPLHKDVLSCSQRVETGEDSVAGQLDVIHCNRQQHWSGTKPVLMLILDTTVGGKDKLKVKMVKKKSVSTVSFYFKYIYKRVRVVGLHPLGYFYFSFISFSFILHASRPPSAPRLSWAACPSVHEQDK